ncbi:FAD-binding oxidoreductase (plasmid) [Deinococcus psychrotolerans]|uniref:FAD-binding oxidoreductase n=1 Tax=Deinococcus psychrotolerans TaxID=2489213 RepID=A0A3G8YIZ9_9DEIO|nr:FAD-binding oxidoreductase [Deinococcus psychrotolerans]AZI44730.1 FAD-binding oxidoreductase [Deinococcus psychrotolerans]
MIHRTADILVIGAGIIGAASAYRLAQRGLKVMVLEKNHPASGSTGKSVAGVRAQFNSATNILLSRESIAEYAAMPESGYRAEGYLMLIPEAGWAAHQEAVALQQSLGIASLALTPDEAQQYTTFNTAGLGGCSFCSTDGKVDAHSLNHEYVRLAREAGARILLDTPVTAIERVGESWRVTTPSGTFEAPQLLNAAGAWSGEIGALAGLDIPVRPARRMVFSTASIDLPKPVPMTFDLASGVYLRSEGERLIFGRADPLDTGWREGMSWDWLEPTLALALERFPFLESASLDQKASWWGYYELTPDQFPVVGRMPGAEGWLNACGFSGHGVMQAAATGRVMAQLALNETPFIDVSPLSIERFAAQEVRTLDLQV